MLFCFGVWKFEKIGTKKKTLSKNDKVEVDITDEQWTKGDEYTTQKVLDAIHDRYPGWAVMGFCPDRRDQL